MQRRTRLDAELVRRGLARSREHAAELIAAGLVRVGGAPASKAATAVRADEPVHIDGSVRRYASRGGDKIAPVLDKFVGDGLVIADKRCLDAGASTGGFTDVLLGQGAASVIAIDVGYGQLIWRLRTDPRVHVLDRVNVRNLTLGAIGGTPVELVVADLSFISLTLVLPALAACATEEADFVVLVKPQFELDRAAVSRGGIVHDESARAAAIRKVALSAATLGLGVAGLSRSALPGAEGNWEFFLWLRAGARALDEDDVERVVRVLA